MRGGLVSLGLGLISVAAAPAMAAVPAPAAAAAATSGGWTMAHFDLGRTGNDTTEPSMAGIQPLWTSTATDGRIYGEPLVLAGIVYVATQRNTIYALNAATGHEAWHKSLGLPAVPLAMVDATAQVSSGCGNIDPLGVTGTPVIDPARGAKGTLYAVAETWDGANGSSIEHRLVAVDLATHAVSSRNIDATGGGFDTGKFRALEQERASLNLVSGMVVVPYGGLSGDCGAYHGFLVSASENLGSGTVHTFEVSSSNFGGGIWGATGPAVGPGGRVFTTTGNGFEGPTSPYEYSDGVASVGPLMRVAGYFAPASWRANDAADADLGSAGPVLIARPGHPALVFATGKQQTGYLLRSNNLGGIGGQVFAATACDQQNFGGEAYKAPFLYVPCREGLRGLKVNTTQGTFSRQWIAPSDVTGVPIVAGGLVWAHGSGRILGLDPSSGATVVTLSGFGTDYNFSSPSANGGTLFYAGDAAGSVLAFH